MDDGVPQRFAKWLRLTSPRTRYLAERLVTHLTPILQASGFEIRAKPLLSEASTMGREFEIERLVGDVADIVTFNFDKYHRPRFQVHAARRALAPPHEFVRSCNLVAKKSQYVYFWGAPALLPSAWWSNALSDRTVERMSNRIHQVIDFLESGERGQNVSQAL